MAPEARRDAETWGHSIKMKLIRHPSYCSLNASKAELYDPTSSPEVMKTLVVEAFILNKGRWEGIQLPQGAELSV